MPEVESEPVTTTTPEGEENPELTGEGEGEGEAGTAEQPIFNISSECGWGGEKGVRVCV